MFKIIKALVGAAAVNADPVETGILYLRREIKNAERNPDALSPLLYEDLSNLALRFSERMSQLSSAEKPVTYFVQHLEYLAGVLAQVLSDSPVEADDSVLDLLRKHRLNFQEASR
jgi:hypothetical protein